MFQGMWPAKTICIHAGLFLLAAASSSPAPPGPMHPGMSIDDVRSAFESNYGLMLRVADPGERNASRHSVSTTVWRHDLPLALFGPPGLSPPDTAGIVLTARAQAHCAFPIDANTIIRVSTENASVIDGCGPTGPKGALFAGNYNTGKCNFTTAEEYVSAYYFKPLVSLLGDPPLWTLEYATCHFTSVPLMLDTQKLLLQKSMHTPAGTTDADWLNNATKGGSGLTAFNEVMATYEAPAVGGMFWAHPGPFRSPHAKDTGACQIAAHLKSLSSSAKPLPIFELAKVNIERPFLGCNLQFVGPPASDCLSRGFGDWQANQTDETGYGRNSSSVLRAVPAATFKSLSCAQEEERAAFV